MKSLVFSLLFLVVLQGSGFFSAAWGLPSSIYVPISDKVYDQIDTLVAHDLIKSSVVGQRPFSRMEVARLVKEAYENLKTICEEEGRDIKCLDEGTFGFQTLIELKKRFKKELQLLDQEKRSFLDLHLLDWIELNSTYLNHGPRFFQNYNGTGYLDGLFQPLIDYREGRHYVQGDVTALESFHWGRVGSFFSFAVAPRFQFDFPEIGGTRAQAFLQEVYGVLQWRNVRLTVGRQGLVLGQGRNGGLLLSNNARSLDHVALSNDTPFKFPWIFKYLGNNRFTLFMGTLGPEAFFKNERIAGYKWNFKPLSLLELGLGNVMQFGGEGAPSMPVGDFFGDYLGFSGTSHSKSNRIIGVEGRVLFPFLRNSSLFAEIYFDDKTTQSWKRTFVDTSAYYTALEVPRLNPSGSLSGKLEFRFISEVFYHHFQFRDGYTLNRRLLGDPLGPDGREVHLRVKGYPKFHTGISGDFYYTRSDGNTYTLTGNKSAVRIDLPIEHRLRWVLGMERQLKKRYEVMGHFGYERVYNYNNAGSSDKNNFLAELGVKMSLDDLVKVKRK